MRTLSELVELELEASGFGKAAYNPFMTADRDRAVINHTGKDLPEEMATAGSSMNGAQNDFDKVRGREHKTSPMYSSMTAIKQAAMELLNGVSGQKLLRMVIEKQASTACGLKSRGEAYQTFGGSDTLNRIKLAGFLDKILPMLPDEIALGIVRRLPRAGRMAWDPSKLEAMEAMIMGKGLRSAAQAGDVMAARRLYEGAGGVPYIDPSDLALLTYKAGLTDQYAKNMSSRFGSGFGLGLGTGGALGLGAGLMAPGLTEEVRR